MQTKFILTKDTKFVKGGDGGGGLDSSTTVRLFYTKENWYTIGHAIRTTGTARI